MNSSFDRMLKSIRCSILNEGVNNVYAELAVKQIKATFPILTVAGKPYANVSVVYKVTNDYESDEDIKSAAPISSDIGNLTLDVAGSCITSAKGVDETGKIVDITAELEENLYTGGDDAPASKLLEAAASEISAGNAITLSEY